MSIPGGPESQPRLNPFDSRIVRSVALQHPVHQPPGAATSVGGGGLAALRRSPTHSAAAHLKRLSTVRVGPQSHTKIESLRTEVQVVSIEKSRTLEARPSREEPVTLWLDCVTYGLPQQR